MAQGQRKGFGLDSITKGCLYIFIGMLGASLLFLMSKDSGRIEILKYGAATGQSIWIDFKLWQLVTSPFLEVKFVGLLFHGFMLWTFLPSLERWWGTKRFLKFAAYTSVMGMVAGTLVAALLPSISDNFAIVGLDPMIYASFIAFGALFANQPVQFFGVLPITGRQLTIGISVFMLAFVLIGQSWAAGAANVSAMGLAWVLTNGKWTPKLWLLKRKQKRIRKHLKVVRGEDKNSKKPKKNWLN